MRAFLNIFGDHKVDEWASDHTLIAARTLNQVAADLILNAEKEIATAGWKDGLVGQNAFIKSRIAPLLREVAEPVAVLILEDANRALRQLVELQAVWTRSPEYSEGEPSVFDGATDVASAAIPLAVGAAAAVSTAATAVTTTTALFGLLAFSTISWPVVVIGGALAGGGIATGVFQGSKLWDKTEARLRQRVRRFIIASLIEGAEGMPSILQQLSADFSRVAIKAKSL